MMFDQLPSFRQFQPQFYRGGPARFHLPLLYDLVALRKPRRIVTVGFGDGEAHLTLCQALAEVNASAHCVAVHRDGKEADIDEAWQDGRAFAEANFAGNCKFFADPEAAINELSDGSVDLLLINDFDSGSEIRAALSRWNQKVGSGGVIVLHGIGAQRADSLEQAWRESIGERRDMIFDAGIGLAIAWPRHTGDAAAQKFDQIFDAKNHDLLSQFYALAAGRIDAAARSGNAAREIAALAARQVWYDSMFADRMKAQEVMDNQARALADIQDQLENLRRDRAKAQLVIEMQTEQLKQLQQLEALRKDRAKAQLVMDAQAEQVRHWTAQAQTLDAERARLDAQVRKQKEILKFAREACRKKGRCFQLPDPSREKKKRSVSERILREIQRVPRNLLGREETPRPPAPEHKPTGPSVSVQKPPMQLAPADRYAQWIAEHEPNADALKEQSAESQKWTLSLEISLLLPVLDTPAKFLEELLASVAEQTYGNWQMCVVDAGSTNRETLEVLERWVAREPRMRFERIETNLGIAENTNRALKLATGDFIVCIDHDDLLAPFALYEIAQAIKNNPDGEIFYSDEDRMTEQGERHSPFFKPEWSPEYLLSFMYLGHLTAYRRDLVKRVGEFRKEFDLSQDYDFALRATEQAAVIRHVPHVLYHWREHAASGSAGGKPHARQTNLAALRDAMERRGLPATILEYPTANRARFEISTWPKVSIIVPTDSAERARYCVEKLPAITSYPDYELVVVTNSALADPLEIAAPGGVNARFVRYDKPFNFSDKCNAGAKAATGSRLIFFNDDVTSEKKDWIQHLIEPLENPEVGAVAPKLLYANGKIQHAGLVTGVRGLVGTACHQWPAESTEYTNFAQSMRNVSALSAACLAMRAEDFFRVGEFDAVNTPIAHSDLDLCFKVRAAGLRCVYTPFVTMTHRGHESIGAVEVEEKLSSREKASVYLLRRWAGYSTHDPFYPDNIRDWLFYDSPTPIQMWGRNDAQCAASQADLLFVSHDLSWSGAPLILFHVAQWCKANGFFVTVMSPKDGPAREKFLAADIPVIVDPLITTGHPSFTTFAQEFDCVIASTIFGAPVIRAAKSQQIPHFWWIHEGRIAEHYLNEDAELRRTFTLADLVVTPDTRSSLVYQPFASQPIRVLPYGIPDPQRSVETAGRRERGPITFLLLGTVEQRKGQQVLLEALRRIRPELLQNAHFRIVGRAHDPLIADEIRRAAEQTIYLTYEEGVSPEEAHDLIRKADVVVCCSWDETGPLILMEALAFGKPILSTTVGAVSEYLSPGEDGLFFTPGDAAGLAEAIQRLVTEPKLLDDLGRTARRTYEKYFTFDRFAEEFGAIVTEAIASQTSSTAPRGTPSRAVVAVE